MATAGKEEGIRYSTHRVISPLLSVPQEDPWTSRRH